MTTPRCAVYWVPPATHPLWRAGCEWLGRDAERSMWTLRSVAPREVTRSPRRYGFHATLKAPLRLREGGRLDAFIDAVASLAQAHQPFTMPPLEVRWLADFLAVRPTHDLAPEHPLRRLADACVRELDEWRAPVSPAELERHVPSVNDDPHARERAQQWGYPHVFDHWRFHMTLSSPLPGGAVNAHQGVEALAREHFAPVLTSPLLCDGLSVFIEPAPGADFVLVKRLPLQRHAR